MWRYNLGPSIGKRSDVIQFGSYYPFYGFWIQGSTLSGAGGSSVYLFNYPAGGSPSNTISGLYDASAVTVSVAPSGSHIRK